MPRKSNPKKEEVRVSLLPQETVSGTDTTRQWQRILLLAFAAVILLIGISAGYFWFRANQFKTVSASRAVDLENTLKQAKDAEELASQVGNIGQLIGLAKSTLQNHVAGERILEILEATTLPLTTFEQIAADAKGTLVLQGQAKDFDTLTRQILIWHESDTIASARVSGIGTKLDKVGNIEGVDFTVTLVVKPEALRWQP